MAYRNKIINNSKTGQSIKFIQTSRDTNGELLEMESTFRANSKEPLPHYHPYQTEDFTVVSGRIMVRVNGQVGSYGENDTFHIPPNTIHSMWNGSEEKAVVNWKVKPALNTENLFETFSGLASDGLTGENGMPPLFQVVLLANKYSNVYRTAKPPYYIQRALFAIFTPIAYLLGYRATYKKYLD